MSKRDVGSQGPIGSITLYEPYGPSKAHNPLGYEPGPKVQGSQRELSLTSPIEEDYQSRQQEYRCKPRDSRTAEEVT